MRDQIPANKLLNAIKPLVIATQGYHSAPVKGITNDSRRVGPGWLFVAIKGEKADGHKFIEQALTRGAVIIVQEQVLGAGKNNTAYIQVADSYYAYARLCECFHAYPARKLRLIGVTGTNGKTSTAYLLRHLLDRAGQATGLISTISYFDGAASRAASRTTPEAGELQELFFAMAENRCIYAVMEVSSHSLAQRRLGTAQFAAALFTNLTGDHLDYHGNMEAYFLAKKRLFAEYLEAAGTAVINIDDPYGRRLAADLKTGQLLTIGQNGADCEIRRRQADLGGTRLELAVAGRSFSLRSPLIGEYNAYNVAGVFAAAYGLGLAPETIIATLEEEVRIPGRLERYTAGTGATIFVDYAHTDDALEKVLRTLRPLTKGKLIVVFGCGGDRDRTKRPRMGAAAAKCADRLVITSDNPRSEDPQAIIREIVAGIPADREFLSEPDREKAIQQAVGSATSGDTILIAGKGHETCQEIKGKFYAFADREVVKKLI